MNSSTSSLPETADSGVRPGSYYGNGIPYLKIDEKTLIRRVLQSRGMDYWESGMDMKLGDDIYESFRAYQRSLLREYASMADEFGFRILDARRKIEVIQDELRRQIGDFLADSDTTSAARIDGQP